MNTFAVGSSRYDILQISSPFVVESPFGGIEFPCLTWDAGANASVDQMEALAKKLINANCRYVVCGGAQCLRWHDAVDEVFVREVYEGQDCSEEEAEARHVMTTWHEGESLEEVAHFFVRYTAFGEHKFSRHLVLILGDDASIFQRLQAAVKQEAEQLHRH